MLLPTQGVARPSVVGGVEPKLYRWRDVGVEVLPVDGVLVAQLIVVHEKYLPGKNF